jgi:hypothetical protein
VETRLLSNRCQNFLADGTLFAMIRVVEERAETAELPKATFGNGWAEWLVILTLCNLASN